MKEPLPEDRRLWLIRYTWTEKGVKHYGHTIIEAPTEADARRQFTRQNPHVKVLP